MSRMRMAARLGLSVVIGLGPMSCGDGSAKSSRPFQLPAAPSPDPLIGLHAPKAPAVDVVEASKATAGLAVMPWQFARLQQGGRQLVIRYLPASGCMTPQGVLIEGESRQRLACASR